MAIQYAVPGGGYLNDSGSVAFAVPTAAYIDEAAGAPTPPISNAFGYAKRRIYYTEPYPDRWYYIRRKAQLNAGTFVAPPPLPYSRESKAYFFKPVINDAAQPLRQRRLTATNTFIAPPPTPYTTRLRNYFAKPVEPLRLYVPRAKTQAIGSAPPPPNIVRFDGLIREVLVSSTGVAALGGLVREVLVHDTGPVLFDGIIREVLSSSPPASGPIPIFPTLPYGFPVKVRPVMATVIGAGTSDREIRKNLQPAALWEIDLLFEELRDQTQNITPYAPLAGFTEYEQLVQLWLSMYGQAGVFAFDAPWDDSREDQAIGTGDGRQYIFTIYRTWGQGVTGITEPIGAINQVFDVEVNGVTVSPANYYCIRNKIYFIDAMGFPHPPGAGLAITMSFSFYYVCRFVENSQDYEEFSKNRWTLSALKFQSVYWP